MIVLVAYRSFAGIGVWVAPTLTARIFGLPPAETPVFPYLSRLAGAREAALAVGTSRARGEARKQWLRLGLACDLLDTLAALVAHRGGLPRRQSAALAMATGVSALLAGRALLAEEHD